MSLLFVHSNEKINLIAKKVFEKHFALDPKLTTEYDERRKMLMYEDILINLGYLYTAMSLEDEKILPEYAIWIFELLCYLMKDLTRERIKDQMILHYTILKDTLLENMDSEEAEKAALYINTAIQATELAALNAQEMYESLNDKHLTIRKAYLDCLFKYDTHSAMRVIENASQSGIKLEEIYIDILQEVMYEVGNLWHQSKITVDKEHYCTSTTQMVLSHFYPVIFSKPRKGLKIITCCVGSELHEMGIRMVSDLFEYNGWDSIYLGAGVPQKAVISAIEENKPHMVGFSVTMPLHLPLCLEYVKEIRKKHKDVAIAVGGRAFQTSDRLWEKWDIDIYTENAQMLVEWATNNFNKEELSTDG